MARWGPKLVDWSNPKTRAAHTDAWQAAQPPPKFRPPPQPHFDPNAYCRGVVALSLLGGAVHRHGEA